MSVLSYHETGTPSTVENGPASDCGRDDTRGKWSGNPTPGPIRRPQRPPARSSGGPRSGTESDSWRLNPRECDPVPTFARRPWPQRPFLASSDRTESVAICRSPACVSLASAACWRYFRADSVWPRLSRYRPTRNSALPRVLAGSRSRSLVDGREVERALAAVGDRVAQSSGRSRPPWAPGLRTWCRTPPASDRGGPCRPARRPGGSGRDGPRRARATPHTPSPGTRAPSSAIRPPRRRTRAASAPAGSGRSSTAARYASAKARGRLDVAVAGPLAEQIPGRPARAGDSARPSAGSTSSARSQSLSPSLHSEAQVIAQPAQVSAAGSAYFFASAQRPLLHQVVGDARPGPWRARARRVLRLGQELVERRLPAIAIAAGPCSTPPATR